MLKTSRRALLKTGLAASAGALAAGRGLAGQAAASMPPTDAPLDSAQAAAFASPSGSPRQRALLDFGWRFHLGHAADAALDFGFGAPTRERTFAKATVAAPAARSEFDDRGWRAVDLPHDWAVELPFIPGDENSAQGWKPTGRDFPESSVGWYRRRFTIPANSRGQRLSLEFDGIFRDAIVLLNDHYLGRNFSGYAPVSYDITDYARPGETNTLAVRVDASLAEGWFYEGAGIYRHVWLTTTGPLHIPQGGTTVRSEPAGEGAHVRVLTEVANHGDRRRDCRVLVRLLDPSGKEAATFQSAPRSVEPWAQATFESETMLAAARLWSCEEPNLYTAVTLIESDGAVADRTETTFGVRSLRFDADKGFLLNGKPVKIKGTCITRTTPAWVRRSRTACRRSVWRS